MLVRQEMLNQENRNDNGWAICMYNDKNASTRRHLEGDRSDMPNANDQNPTSNISNVMIYFLKILFTFSFCVVELFINSVINKWLWNVLFVVMNIALDIFFHLVLALAAIMVVMILNIDDVYLQVKNENLKDLDAVNDEDRTLNIIQKETYPDLM